MKYCPRCLRPETETENCPNGDFPGMNCPPLAEEDPAKDITIACGPCDFTRVVPVRELIQGQAKNKLPSCKRDECACVVVSPEKAPVLLDPVMPEVVTGEVLVYDALKPGHIEAFLSDDPVPPPAEEPEGNAETASSVEEPSMETASADPATTPSEAASEETPAEEPAPAPTKKGKAK